MIAHTLATDLVLQDLFDCLLAEDVFAGEAVTLEPVVAEHPLAMQGATPEVRLWEWCGDPSEQRFLAALVRPGITQAWEKVPGTPVMARQGDAWSTLSPDAFVALVFARAAAEPEQARGIALLRETLATSLRQTTLSLGQPLVPGPLLEGRGRDAFLQLERWAALRDRPYHPLAKAKLGLNDADYQAYQAEFAQPVRLAWVAVRRDQVLCGEGVAPDAEGPAEALLAPADLDALRAELRQRGLAQTHVALPLHPWQRTEGLPGRLDEAFASGVCQHLDFAAARCHATSSLRSMIMEEGPGVDQLKLPMAVYSLGASRYLPAVKMINGERSEALLRQARTLDPLLAEGLHLCDERRWWAFMPPAATLFDEAPRHLSAMVRGYPAALLADPDCRLLPMAALGTPLPGSRRHFFDDWLAARALAPTPANVARLLGELCHRFIDLNLRLFRLGLLGEVHGQNAVLVWRAGHIQGLLLRDHDSLRLYVPWLERQGLADPQYRIKPGHAQTLYHEHPRDLLFWFQTLGIQVNLRAIFETLADCYELPLTTAWTLLREVLEERIAALDFDTEARSLLRETLFEAPDWPQKWLLRPMIERAGGPGSMPFGKGRVANPFHQVTHAR
ncbi:IucA/IucC family protein [Pseudomonas oryzihabitans]|uniref:IucA/IucC family protein n=1 Tax=Pseudomonas oryzihabitans TaxID=47885 RepID=UPI0011A37F4C|nr:IucA/IucC family protein [Pseudomonas psychrotolerans]